MSKENYKNYFNGGCSTCMFAERDERGRYIGPCSGFSNCSYEEYKGETDITEEEKDEKIADLEAKLSLTEKALELACKELHCELENPDNELYTKSSDEYIEYFKTKAKEIGNNE